MPLDIDDGKHMFIQDTHEIANSSEQVRQRRTGWLVIESINEFDQLLKRHPYLRDNAKYPEHYHRVKKYFKFKSLRSMNPQISIASLARNLGIPETTVFYWKKGIVPTLMKALLDNERVLREKESSMTMEYRKHYVPYYRVYSQFRKLSTKSKNIKKLSHIIEEISKTSSESLHIVELKPFNKGYQSHMQKIVRRISRFQKQIECEFDKRFGENASIRIAVLDDNLYIWNQKKVKKHFLLLADELFYFHKNTRESLIHRTQRHLGGIGVVRLSKIISQMTGYTFSKKAPVDSINADLKHEKRYLSGRTLRFIINVLNDDFDSRINQVKELGRGRQILNPKILNDALFNEVMTRLFAIIGSDGHIQQECDRIQYSEWNSDRRDRVHQLIQQFGNIALVPRKSKGKVLGLYFPSVIGRILLKLGIPAGDKVLQGYNLPRFILSGPPTTQSCYLEELLPEEACLSIRKNGMAYVILGRRVVLRDPSKLKKYRIQSKVNQTHLSLIKKFGRKDSKCYDKDEVIENSIVLSRSVLKKLTKKSETSATANHLLKIIKSTPPLLLEDEQRLLTNTGIHTKMSWKVLTFYESGRISVLWEVRTSSQNDTALWGTIAPPNDVVKFEKFQHWLETRHN
ncbi:hypothetical protein EU528_02425 [Candidatus Thorarchaeota archaeon]|nr:MAG: hypothetical protein EU528_02425 [Candidatus Thorarchaeota archaeon]